MSPRAPSRAAHSGTLISAARVLHSTRAAGRRGSTRAASESSSTDTAVGAAACSTSGASSRAGSRSSRARPSTTSGNSSSLLSRLGSNERGRGVPSTVAIRSPSITSESHTTARAGHHSQVASSPCQGVSCSSRAPSRPWLAGLAARARSSGRQARGLRSIRLGPIVQVNRVAARS